jgi:ribosome-binding protein aMBF1 (putative translation factor)
LVSDRCETFSKTTKTQQKTHKKKKLMKITTNHPCSHYGIPVILDDNGDVMDDAPGIKAVRRRCGLTAEQFAAECGVSVYTVNAWEQGINGIKTEAFNVLDRLLKEHRKRVRDAKKKNT